MSNAYDPTQELNPGKVVFGGISLFIAAMAVVYYIVVIEGG